MKNGRVTVHNANGILITVARTAPVQTTIIATRVNNTIETITNLKQVAAAVIGVQANTGPVAANNFTY